MALPNSKGQWGTTKRRCTKCLLIFFLGRNICRSNVTKLEKIFGAFVMSGSAVPSSDRGLSWNEAIAVLFRAFAAVSNAGGLLSGG